MKHLIYLVIALFTLSCTTQEKKLPDNFDFGKTENGTYENSYFNIKIPFNPDWVVQNEQQVNNLIETGSEMVSGDNAASKAAIKASVVKTAYLLTIFKHEIGSAVDFNPAFMVIAENIEASPGIKTGSDYLFHAKKLMLQTQVPYYFDKEVYEKQVGGQTFHVLESKVDRLGTVVSQDYISTVIRGFSLSFIASYSSEQERDELYEIIENIEI